ncbi:phosphoglycerate dehydrogenase [Paenibacillus thalictri]|uniref:Hydroxyacid dehydrogenase n=1 Tax=Paenibacillus thalictri TaxID=2527873 RepID=A0A4V2J456_9BACL|nr:phosphoglycerate dehydrogenase [Paenibacillus thalictri]TBL77859.1 hydroxyacid dehydrogenase [Paenibacillus thalictri]
MSGKVLVTPDMFHPDAVNVLKEAGFAVEFTKPTRMVTEQEVREKIADADAYVVGSNKLTAELIGAGQKLKLIARFGVGYDSIDWRYALQSGIAVTVTAGANEQSVADMALALMLSISRRIPYFDRSVREGEWTPQILTHEMWAKTVGIMGTGRIGKAVAKRVSGFDANLLAYDAYPDYTWAQQAGVTYVSKEQLLSESDYVTLHLPLNEDTNRIVDAGFLLQMKPTAFLINTARGQLVDETALYEALVQRSIGGAALDVYAKEPLPRDYPFYELDNCVLTHHVSSHTQEAMRRMSLLCAEEIVRMNQGLPPQYPIPEKL